MITQNSNHYQWRSYSSTNRYTSIAKSGHIHAHMQQAMQSSGFSKDATGVPNALSFSSEKPRHSFLQLIMQYPHPLHNPSLMTISPFAMNHLAPSFIALAPFQKAPLFIDDNDPRPDRVTISSMTFRQFSDRRSAAIYFLNRLNSGGLFSKKA